MPLYRPSELRYFLNMLQAAPNKKLSQNFLIDGNIIQKILGEAKAQEGDHILEIGPGPGALTEALLGTGARVTAVEKDPYFSEALSRFPDLTIYRSDILDFSLECMKGEKVRAKVVANLPYHLTSPILGLLLPRHDLFSTVTVMVQEEVARRIVAPPKNKEYSALTLFVNFYSYPRYAFGVSRNSFYPRPKVDSAVITCELKSPPIREAEPFLDFVRLLFCHRRKMIRTILSSHYSKEKIDKGLQLVSASPLARPEELSCDQMISLFLIVV